jgi:hypothetical protein
VRCLGHRPHGADEASPEGTDDPSGWYSLSDACRRCQNCADPGGEREAGYKWEDDGSIPCWVEDEIPNMPADKIFRRMPPAHVLAWNEAAVSP